MSHSIYVKMHPKGGLQDFNISTDQVAQAKVVPNHRPVAASSSEPFAALYQDNMNKAKVRISTATSTPYSQYNSDAKKQQLHCIFKNNTNETEKHQCCTSTNQVFITQNKLLSNQTQILEQLQSLEQFQNVAYQKINRFSVQLLTSSKVNESMLSKPITNRRELDELEKKLSNNNVRNNFKNTYSIICQAGKALNCASVLADLLFSREFLCQCSWAGGSRTGNSKIRWKQYKNILYFFWEVIHLCNSNYSIKDNEAFFKNLLKSSKTRTLAKKGTTMLFTGHTSTIESDGIDSENENVDLLENVSLQNYDELNNDENDKQTTEKKRREGFDPNVASQNPVHSAPEYNKSSVGEHQCCTYMKHILMTHKQMLLNQTQILDQLKSLKKFQDMAIKKITTFSVQLDDALLEVNDKVMESQIFSLEKHKSSSSAHSFHQLKPIENVEELDELERKLSDSVTRKKLKATYSILCSKGKGIDCAYSLADLLFSRGFLCLCSWSGGSRNYETKICWKFYKNTLNFFWEMIHSWDSTYTLQDNENFFRTILRNSRQRYMSKQERTSTSRRHTKLRKDIEKDTNEQANRDTENSNCGTYKSKVSNRENNDSIHTETIDIESDIQITDESEAEDNENIIENFNTQNENKSSDDENIQTTEENNDVIECENLEQISIIKAEYVCDERPNKKASIAITSLDPQNSLGGNILQSDCDSLENTYSQSCNNINQIFAIQTQLLSNQSEMLEKLKTLKHLQNITIQKITNFSVQLDDAQLQLNNQITDNHYSLTKSFENSKSFASNPIFELKPIDTIEELNELEKNLLESDTREQLKSTYSIICSGGKGVDCAYTLVDLMFSREFICQCSWAGGSRGEDIKICWKLYKNTLTFFWEMIHSWDSSYTIQDNESFFKNILRNAKKRSLSKQQRRSASRRRPKRIKLNRMINCEQITKKISKDCSVQLNQMQSTVERDNKDKKVQNKLFVRNLGIEDQNSSSSCED